MQWIDGLEGLPELRTQDDDQGYNDGMFSGRDFLAGRTLAVGRSPCPEMATRRRTSFNLLQAALLPQRQGASSSASSSCRPTVRPASRRPGAQAHRQDRPGVHVRVHPLGVAVLLPDPRYYDDTLLSGAMAPSLPGGRTYNRTYNLVYPAQRSRRP